VLGHIDAPIEVSVEIAGFQRLSRTLQLAEFKEESQVMRAALTLSLTPLPVAVSARRAAPPAARAPKPPEPTDQAPPAPAADTPVVQIKPAAGDAPAAAAPPAAAVPPDPAPSKPAEAAPPPTSPEPSIPSAP
jgi:hypothetical protein